MSIGHTYAYEYDGAYATILSVSVLPPPTTLYTWMDVRSSYLTVGLSFSLRHVTDTTVAILEAHVTNVRILPVTAAVVYDAHG